MTPMRELGMSKRLSIWVMELFMYAPPKALAKYTNAMAARKSCNELGGGGGGVGGWGGRQISYKNYSEKVSRYSAFGRDIRMNLKCSRTFTGEANFTFSVLLNAHVQLFK